MSYKEELLTLRDVYFFLSLLYIAYLIIGGG